MERLVGQFDSGKPGPTVVIVGGVHGSEPAGVHAGQRVLESLPAIAENLKGRIVVLRGNIEALKIGRRYVDRDLNRMWQSEDVAAVLSGAGGESAEHEQMRDLAVMLNECFATALGPVFFLDLHTTSSETIPFFWLLPGGATDVITHYGMPSVFDPMMKIGGTLAQWVAGLGHRVLLAEGGQHLDSAAVDHCEAIIWITLVQAGLVSEQNLQPHYRRSQQLLHGVCQTQGFFNIVHHHKVSDGDQFEMRPGYRSFQPVKKGELLAFDKNGDVAAGMDGRILMPLYKPPCDDGFLIVQEDELPPHF